MKYSCLFLLALAAWLMPASALSQQLRLLGRVVDTDTGKGVEYASVLLAESGLWAVTDGQGRFVVKDVPTGKERLSVQCLGYEKQVQELAVSEGMKELVVRLRPATLKVDEVTVTARRKQDEATTSYTISRQALDQQQLLSLSDVAVLLPGGKTTNPTLMSDARLALRSGSQEGGNASFGTAIEVDGQRLDNNAATGETAGASTRTLSASDIESVEIVTGIPSVEYGDLSNGIVKVNTRRGKSPFIVEGTLNQHTRQIAVSKGFSLGHRAGMMNASAEHARSFSNPVSPHTAYQRNVLSLRYSNTFLPTTTPLTLSLGLTGNVGGYNSEADPDEELDDYTKVRDNTVRGHFDLQWLLNRRWVTNVQLSGSFSYSDKRQERYAHASSASTQPYLHATAEGYFMAVPLSSSSPFGGNAAEAPLAAAGGSDIVLGPTGYWYVLGFHDSKPVSWQLKLKADWVRRLRQSTNRLLAGAQLSGSRNDGRGTYYADLSVAPSWREYRYDRLPAMRNVAFYAEDKLSVPVGGRSAIELTAGLRHDLTLISGSDYGTVGSLSPRANGRYVAWRGQQERWVSDLQLHAGWGRSVKLPSMQVLYPQPAYSDLLCFASTSTADNTSYYAYHVFPTRAAYNPGLRWQYTDQTDLGVELTVKGTRITLSAFHHRTGRSYMSARTYTPFSYRYTGQTAVQQSGIPAEDRRFSIDRQEGTVTVYSAQDPALRKELAYTDRQTYTVGQHYENASPLSRYGLEWVVDFAQLQALRTRLRLDGNYYRYKSLSDVLFADVPLGVSNIMTDGQPYQYVGYYRGAAVTSAGSSANASVSNGALSRQLNLNATLTTHIPRIRLVVALRLESSLQSYRRALSQLPDGSARGYMPDEAGGYFGEPYDPSLRDRFVVLYPEYYSTWEEPALRLPFAERFSWARDNDATLYSDLAKLVVRTNYAYTMNPNRLSSYYSANLSVTKELGNHISLSFYANNFLNTMRRVRSSQTGLETSLFESGYVPAYYYGLSMRVKI